MTLEASLELARTSHRAMRWESSYVAFCDADAAGPLDPDDVGRWALSAYLSGRGAEHASLMERAFHQRMAAGATEAAAEDAFWLSFALGLGGEWARASGWMARAAEIQVAESSPVRGLLLVPRGVQQRHASHDPRAALEIFAQAHEIGQRTGHQELLALSGLGIGLSKIDLGESAAGLARIDEAMVTVTGGGVSALAAGHVYCAVIDACQTCFDVRRATEWTRALSAWCAAQPDLVPFRGLCLVHRAQLLTLSGDWGDAAEQAELACTRLDDPPGQAGVGAARYQRAELHRLRGELASADEGFRQAGLSGYDPQPGLALLRLAQRRPTEAVSGIRRALQENRNPGSRPSLLAAATEIDLALGDLGAAGATADELAGIAETQDVPLLLALAAQSRGAVRLAEGDPGSSLGHLGRAWELWHGLGAPYQCARVRVLRGRCCEALGDSDAATMDFAAAAETYRDLRAAPDLAALGDRAGGARTTGLLTAREVQVLRAVASGSSNRSIAEDLVLSEKTVARHVANIYGKIDVSSRSAATAYAYQHELA